MTCIHERRLELSKAQRECRKEKQPAIMVLPKYSWPCSGGNCTTTLRHAWQSHDLATETECQQLFQTRLDFTVILHLFLNLVCAQPDDDKAIVLTIRFSRSGMVLRHPIRRQGGEWQMTGKNIIAYAWFNMCRKLIQLRRASHSEVLFLATSDLFMEQGPKQVRALYEMMTGV